MSNEDAAIQRLTADRDRSSAADQSSKWALDQAKSLIGRYVRALKQAGRQPADIHRPTYTLEQYEEKSGPVWARKVNSGHRWALSEDVVGKGWPVISTLGWSLFTRDATVNRDEQVKGYRAPNAVVYMDTTNELKPAVVADSSTGLSSTDYSGAQRAVLDSRKLWVEPRANGAICSHGWCGLPIWVWAYLSPTQVNRVVDSELRIRGAYEDFEDGPVRGSLTRVTAPQGRGQDAYDWYLRDLLAVLNDQLETLGHIWV